MATDSKAEDSQQTNEGDASTGFVGRLEARYRVLKEDVEAFPYVWASYAAVYGTFGLWFIYRWRKLRKTEDRVRALQERLRQLAQAEESASASSTSAAAASSQNASTSARASSTPAVSSENSSTSANAGKTPK